MSHREINNKSCPSCDCWVVLHTSCGCEGSHIIACENCGRYATLADNEYATRVEANRFDLIQACKRGPEMHRHTPTPREFLAEKPSREEFQRGIPC